MTFGPIITAAQSALFQRLRGLGRGVAGLCAALLVVLLTASNLRAADYSLDSFIANLNGPVNAIAYGNGITYLGGAFSTVTFNSGSMANLSDSTGLPDPNWPVVTGQLETVDACLVDHIISDGSGGWYISGNFTAVGGVTRNGMAHILSNETVDPTFNANANSRTYECLLLNGVLYAAGEFTTIGGASRSHIAALNPTTGVALSTFNAGTIAGGPTGGNGTMIWGLDTDGTNLYIGGEFTSVNGTTRENIAAVSAATGSLSSWNPNANNYVYWITYNAGDGNVYVGGAFTTIGGATRNYLAAITTAGTATAWNPNMNGAVWYTYITSAGVLYACGQFTTVNGGTKIPYIASFSVATANTGTALTWNCNANTTVWWCQLVGTTLYVAGDFTSVGGATRNYIGAVSSTTGTATSWAPSASSQVYDITANGTTGILAGGPFSSVSNGVSNVVAVNSTSGAEEPWTPSVTGTVDAMALSGTTLYIGGAVTNIAGETVTDLGAINTSTGAAVTWAPALNGAVSSLLLNGTTLYAGGAFTSVGGSTTYKYAAAWNTSTGAQAAWNPVLNGAVDAMALNGSDVFLGGAFTTLGGAACVSLGEVDGTVGTSQGFNGNCNKPVTALYVGATEVYAGGTFTTAGPSNTARSLVASWDLSSNALDTTWNPDITGTSVVALNGYLNDVFIGGTYTKIGSTAEVDLASVSPTSGAINGSFAPAPTGGAVNALYVNSAAPLFTLFVGGAFTAMQGSTREDVASFDLNQAPTAIQLSGTTVINNSVNGTVIGNLTTTDPNPNDTFTYSLSSSAGGLFGISGAHLVVANATIFSNPPPASYSITVVTTDADNQSFSQAFTITVTVVKTVPVITWAAPANIVYGTALSATQLDATANVAGTFAYTPALGTVLQAGASQALSVTFTPTDTTDYSNANATTTISVTPAVLTVTANNASRLYRTANPAFTVSYSGFENGDSAANLGGTLVVSTTANMSSATGTYPITASGLASSNYTINYVAGTLTIAANAPVITWAAPASIVYGTALSATQLDATASVAGTFAYTPALGTVLKVGANQVLSETFTPTDTVDYTTVTSSTTITVTAAPLTVTATNLGMTYGGTVPTLTDTITGFVNGDTISVVSGAAALSTTATATSTVGTYPITAALGTLSATNYSFSFVSGTMTVSAAVLTVTANNASMTYGGAVPALTDTITGYVNGQGSSVITGSAALSTTALSSSAVGTYPISAAIGTLAATNYTFSFAAGTMTVNPAALTITGGSASMTYGAALPTITFTSSGLVNGDAISSVTEATSAGPTSAVGSYPVTPSAPVFTHGAVADYTITYVNGTVTVGTAVLTVTATNASRTYGAANPAFTYTVSGLKNTDTITGVTETTTAVAGSAVGTYAITPSAAVFGVGVATNYTITYVNGTLTVGTAALSVTATNASRTYGAANPTFTYTVSGLENTDTITGVTETTTAVAGSPVGTYAITPSAAVFGVGVATNYTITYVNGTLTVGTAALSVTATNANRTYGAANPAFTYTVSGLENTDTITGVTETSTAVAGSPVGTYAITPSAAVFGVGVATNYTITYVNGTLTVGTAALSVTATNANRTYGVANPAFTYTVSGLENTDTITGVTETTTAVAGSAVGTYAITPSAAVFGVGVATNYTITYVNGTLTVGTAALSVTATNANRTYGAANPAFTYTVSGLENTDTITGVTETTTAVAGSAVGTYAITPSAAVFGVGSATNYTITYVNGTLTVGTAALSVTATNANRTYGAANPAFTYTVSGLENTDTITGVTETTTAVAGSPVGTYAITPSAAVFGVGSATNYTITYVNGTLTVGTAALSVTATNANRTYGAANPAFTYTVSGLENTDTITGVTETTTAVAGSAVGTYAITPSAAVFGVGSATNYTITYVNGTLTVGKAALSVTATNANRTYGAANPAFTYTVSGLENTDTITGVTETTTAVAGSPVGTYAITPSAAVFGVGVATNYTITYVNGTLTVGTAALSVTATNANRTYGAANPAFTYTVSGLENTDTITGVTETTTAVAGSPVGTYAITPSAAVFGVGVATNYTITYVNGTLTVGTAALSVTATNANRTYGAANPAFTYTVSGLENTDTITGVTETSTAVAGSAVGTYAITPSAAVFGVGVATNYTITYVNGTLTVGTAALSVTATNANRTYGAANPAFTYTVSGLENTDTITGVTETTTAVAGSAVGTYAITPSAAVFGVGSATNYTITYVNGTLTVGTAALSVTATNANRTYGAANPAFTYTVSGLENTDTITGVTETTTAVAGSAVGTYAITPSAAVFGVGSATNYTITYVNGTLTVGKAALSVTATNANRTYGAANPAFTYTVSGLENTDTITGVTETTTAVAGSPVGTYAITPSAAVFGVGVATNYTITYVNGTLTVGTAALSVTATNANRTYGAANPAFTYTVNGLENTDTITGVTETTTAVAGSAVGTYAITPSAAVFGVGAATNYTITYVNGTLTVGTAALSVTATNANRTYGAANPAFTYSVSGLENTDTITGVTETTTAVAGSAVGTYAITPSAAVFGVGVATNYTITYVNGTLTVGTAALSVTATNANRTYGAANPAFTYTVSGLENTDTITGVTETTTAVAGSPVGTYAITPSAAVFGVGVATNYTITYVNGTLTVGTAALSVTATNANRTYGAANPAFTYTVSGLENTDTITGVTETTTAVAGSPVGTYAITPSAAVFGVGVATNYTITYVNGTLTVGTAALSVTATNANRTYGAANPAFTYTVSGLENTDTITGVTETTTAVAGSAVGTYAITPSAAVFGVGSATNYTITYVNGTLTVGTAALSVTATNANRTYGAANPAFTYTVSGLENTDTITGVTETTTAVAGSAVGTYAITPSAAVFGVGSATNYTITYVNGTLTVGKAALSVTATNANRTYGAANPAFTYTVSGLENTDTITGVTETTTAVAGSPVGTYAITPSAAVFGVGVATNYTITYVNGTLTVGTAALSVTATNANRIYGAANPAFTYTVSGLENTDTITGVTETSTAVAGSAVGTYAITPSAAVFGVGVATNYTITYVNGTLTVGTAALSVTATNASRTYGAANPTFTYTVSGLENTDTITGVTETTTAVAGSPVGTYAITPSAAVFGVGVATNYTITYVNGTLTVGTAALSVTATNANRTYGAANPAFTYTVNGLENTDTITGVTETTTAVAGSPVGTYAITPSAAVFGVGVATNYTITYVNGTLTVGTAALSVTATNASRTYGAANPAFTYTVSGLENTDTITGVTETTTAVAGSAVGTYAITPSAAVFGVGVATNYTITYVNGTLTVGTAALSVTATNANRTYGAANPAFTYTVSGLENTDTITGVTETSTAVAGSPVGTYAITPSAAVFGVGVATNYTITYVNGTLTVGTAALSVTATNANRTYGVANPAFTYTVSGLENTDTITGVTETTTAVAGSPVGTYAITPSAAVFGVGVATNYTITYVNGTLTVGTAALSVTATNASRTYGAANPAFTYTVSGLENTDTITGVTETTTAVAGSAVGTYAITPSAAVFGVGVATNYTITYVNGTLTVGTAALSVTATNANRTYGAANPAFTYTVSGLENTDTITGVTETTTAVAGSAVGTYAITPSAAVFGVGVATNYTITYVNGTLTVGTAALSVTATNANRTYGAANPAFTYTVSGLENTDTITGVTETTTAVVGSPVGTYAITPSAAVFGVGAATNYTITYVNGTLTVGTAALSVTATNANRTYGAANPAFTYTVSGLENTDTITGVTETTTAVAGSAVGTYAITPSAAVFGVGVATNYTITYVNGTLTVGTAALSVTATNANRTYGAANPAFTYTVSGLENTDTITGVTETTTAVAGSLVGTYAITPSAAVFGVGSATNYTITYVNGTLTVGTAALSVTATNANRTYGAANPAFTYTVSGLENTDTITGVTETTTAVAGSAVGTYAITPSAAVFGVGSATNYTITYVNGTLTVGTAALSVTATNANRTYGAANPAFTYTVSGLENTDTITGVTETTTAVAGSAVGTYAITPSAAVFGVGSATNYTITYVNGTLTVGTAALSVTATNANRTYGAANPAFTYTVSGLENTDTITGVTETTTAVAGSPVGTYAITPSAAVFGVGAATNYTITYVNGTLTVGTAALSVTATNANRTYGAANPAFTYTVSGLENTDTITGVTETSTAVAGSAVGTYAITPSAAVFGVGVATNYTITYVNGTLTVGTAALSVTATNANRTYGAANPAFTYTVSGLENTDTITGVTETSTAVAGSAVGTYAITPSAAVFGVGVATNYTITYVNGTLTVGTAALSVTATNANRTYGAANPAFTYTVSGLENTDTITGVTETTTAVAGSAVGTYAITPSAAVFGVGIATNYTITYVNGTLTVGTAALSVTATNANRTYGAANPAFTYTVSGLENTDTITGVTETTTAVAGSPVGTYAITPSAAVFGVGSATNYTITYVNGTLTVGTAALSVTATNANRTYGAANPAFTYTVSGLENTDTITGVTETTTAVAGSAVGTYAITPSAAVFGVGSATNYTITYVNGTLTVGTAALSVTATNANRTYGAANPAFTYTVSGLENTDTITGVTETTTAVAGSPVGTYAITPSAAVFGVGAATNYTITYVNGTLTVGTAALSVTATNANRTYGAANPAFTYTVSGLENTDTITGVTETTTAVAASPVGTYAITPSAAVFGVGVATNYTITYVNGTLTVGTAALSVTATNANRTYGAANPAFTYTVSGLENTDTITGVTETTTAVAGSPVGTYAITPSAAVFGVGSATNYTITYVNGTLTVGTAALSVTATNANRTYGVANPAFTYTVSGLENTDTITGVTETTTAVAGSAVGTYAITPSAAVFGVGVATNYTITYVNGTLTVGKAALSVTATNANRTYGAANPAFTYTVSGLENTDTITGVTETSTAVAGSAVGTYAITPSAAVFGVGVATNYTITYVNGTLTVGTAALSVTATNANRTYGAANPAFTYTVSGLENTDTITGVTETTTAVAASPVGTYAITPSAAVFGVGVATNYTITYVNGTLTVGTAALSVTATNANRTYGAANPAFTYTVSGLENTDTITGVTETTTAVAGSPVGTYAITPSAAVFGVGSATNYTITYVNGTLTVGKAALSVTATNANRTYGAANPAFTYTVSGLENTDTITGVTETTTAVAGSAVGTYAITPSAAVFGVGAATNYTITYVNGTLTVGTAALSVTATNANRTYGAANPAFTYTVSGLENTDTITGVTETTTAVAGSAVGTYAITPSAAVFGVGVATNYTITYVNGTLTVGTAALSVTATNANRTYGAANPAFTYTVSGLENTDTITGVTETTTAVAGSPVGTYAITPSAAVFGVGAATNYTITYVNGTLTVGTAALSVTATNANRTYGAANPAFTYTVSGLENTDTITGVTETTTAVAGSPVGTYAITPSAAVFGVGVATNYTITYVNGTLTVGTAALSVTATNANRTYGAANPAFTYTVSGLENTDTITGVTETSTAVAGSAVGTYAITPSAAVFGVGVATNYTITYVNGTLTVGTAALSVTATNANRTYGAANPAFTYTVSGLENTDTITGVTETTTAVAGSPVGTYAITPSAAVFGVGSATNYTITYVNGTLTVGTAALSVTATNANRTYGAANPAFTYTVSGLENTDTITGVTETTTAVAGSAVGTYAITPSAAVFGVGSATNYTITYVNGTLTVGTAALSVTATNANRTYGAANPAFTYTVSGLENTDTITGVTETTTAVAASPVGTYAITPSAAVFGVGVATNYTITYVNGTLTVGTAALSVTATNANRTYGAANPTFTYTVSGLENTDTITGVTETTTAVAGSAVGTYAITPSAAVFGVGAATNYTITYVNGTLTVGTAALSVTATNANRTYGAANPTFTYTVSGLENTDTITGVTETTTAVAGSAVGTYAITPSAAVFGVGSATNYTITYVNGTLTVGTAALSVTATNANRTYGAANPAFTYTVSGLENTDTITGVTESTTAVAGSPVGTYAITPSAAVFGVGAATNYTITYVNGTLSVTAVTLTVTANSASMVYGVGSLPTFTVSYSGFVNGDTASSLSGSPAFSSTATSTSGVGSYTITPSQGTLSDPNYSMVFATGTLTITPATLTVMAANTSRPYGSANPVFTANYTGFKNGDSAAVLSGSPSLTTTTTSGSNAGTYTITAALGTLTDANYTFSFVNGTLTVTKVALNVTATSLSMNYGGTVPTLSYGITGFVNGDTSAKVAGAPTLSTTAVSGSPAGPYPITILSGSLVATNYTFTMINGVLTINQAVLTVTPSNASRTYGASNPNFSVNYSGFINGDNYSVVSGAAAVSSSAVATSPVGNYPIIASLGSLAATNYSFLFAPGILTVTQAQLTVTADPAFMTYGAEDPAFTATYTGFQNSDNAAVVGGAPSFTSTDTSFSPVGYYTVVPSLGTLTATNYSFSFVNGVLTINPANLSIAANDTSMVVNTALPALTASYIGFVGSDDPSVLSGTFQLTNNAQTSTPGQYAISITTSGITADNYLVSLSDGVLSVIGAASTVDMTPTGGLVDGDNALDALSADGSSVLFTSDGANMPGQPQNSSQPMLYLRTGGSVAQISQGAAGQGSMSGDANYITYIYPQGTIYSSPFEIEVLDRSTNTYTTESYSNSGALADDWCTNPMISDSGEYVVFECCSTLLTGANSNPNENRDIIYRDRFAGSNQDRVLSLDMYGNACTGDCQLCAVSPDGRYVAFTSTSTTLLPGTVYSGTNPYGGGYLYDTQTSTLTRIDLTQSGGQPDDEVGYAMAFSADDHYLVFSSLASNLVHGVTNGYENVYRYDLCCPVGSNISLVSVNADGTQGNLACYAPRVSWDGRFVGFLADGGSFDPNDTNSNTDIYLVDMDPHSASYQHMARVSLAYNGAQGDSDVLYEFCMSRNASTVAWYSFADNIAPDESDPGVDMNVFELATWVPASEDPPPTGDG